LALLLGARFEWLVWFRWWLRFARCVVVITHFAAVPDWPRLTPPAGQVRRATARFVGVVDTVVSDAGLRRAHGWRRDVGHARSGTS
jgi:hypothetical protein